MTRRLHLQFDRSDDFRREFERNIAKGGVFVPGAHGAELREIVEVELALAFCGRTSRLEAEVVHVVSASTAPGPGAVGVAVQFLRGAPEVRAELADALAGVPAASAPAGSPVVSDRWVLDGVGPPAGGPGTDARDEGGLIDLADTDLDLGGDLFGAPGDFSTAPDPLAAGSALDPVVELEVDPRARTVAVEVDPAARTVAVGVAPAPDPQAESATAPFVERRRAPRSPARVPTRVEGANARIDGLTRDLSETGALISADASEFPVGKEVRLSLQHPEKSGTFEVAGRVVRHLETEGTVAAVSVLFDVPPGRKDELASLVRAAQRVHQERAASGITGRIEELGMPALIQMLGSSAPQGTLAVRSGAEEGVLAFDDGVLRYVRLGATRGLKALARMARWTEGSFEFHAHVAALLEEDPPIRLEAALLELARRADEAGARFDPAQRFRIDRDALAAADALDKTEEAVLDLAAAGFTVRRILDVIPEGDAEVSAALLGLLERGVLQPG